MPHLIQKKKSVNGACRIIVKDGRQYLAMPDGTVIPKQVWTRVTDPLNDLTYAIVQVIVNLDDTKPE